MIDIDILLKNLLKKPAPIGVKNGATLQVFVNFQHCYDLDMHK